MVNIITSLVPSPDTLANGETDIIIGSPGGTFSGPHNNVTVINQTTGGAQTIDLSGNNVKIIDNSTDGNNVLKASGSNNIFKSALAGLGDTMDASGGTNDYFYSNNAGDTILPGSSGVQQVTYSVNPVAIVPNGITQVMLTGSANTASALGTTIAKTFIANPSALLNTLTGGLGNDTFYDSGKPSNMTGGGGTNTFHVSNAADTINAAGDTNDVIYSSVSITSMSALVPTNPENINKIVFSGSGLTGTDNLTVGSLTMIANGNNDTLNLTGTTNNNTLTINGDDGVISATGAGSGQNLTINGDDGSITTSPTVSFSTLTINGEFNSVTDNGVGDTINVSGSNNTIVGNNQGDVNGSTVVLNNVGADHINLSIAGPQTINGNQTLDISNVANVTINNNANNSLAGSASIAGGQLTINGDGNNKVFGVAGNNDTDITVFGNGQTIVHGGIGGQSSGMTPTTDTGMSIINVGKALSTKAQTVWGEDGNVIVNVFGSGKNFIYDGNPGQGGSQIFNLSSSDAAAKNSVVFDSRLFDVDPYLGSARTSDPTIASDPYVAANNPNPSAVAYLSSGNAIVNGGVSTDTLVLRGQGWTVNVTSGVVDTTPALMHAPGFGSGSTSMWVPSGGSLGGTITNTYSGANITFNNVEKVMFQL